MDFRLIRHLYYFLVIAEERHFGRAAARLGMTQPPLSAQIKVLEHVLGVELFERSRAGVRLTSHGEAILPSVRRIVENGERLESLVHLAKSGNVNMLSVGAVTSAMFHPLSQGIDKARKEIAGFTISLVEMDTADAISALMAEEIDLAFIRTETVPEPLIAQPIVREKLVVALHESHPMASSDVLEVGDLAEHPLVMCPRRVSPTYVDAIYSLFSKANVFINAPHSASSIATQIAMVSCGVGAAVVPQSFSQFSSPHVIYRPLRSEEEVVTIAAVWNEKRESRLIADFIDIVGSLGNS